MSRLTKQYADTKRYYSTHSCDEILQKLGKLEDIMEQVNISSIDQLIAILEAWEVVKKDIILDDEDESAYYLEYLNKDKYEKLKKALEVKDENRE